MTALTKCSMLLLVLLMFNAATSSPVNDCYVTPCSRDVIFTVDNTPNMQSTDNVFKTLDFVASLTNDWTLSSSTVRVAVFGFLFEDEYQFSDYISDQPTLSTKFAHLKTQSNRRGLFKGDLNEMLQVVYINYMKNDVFPPRSDVQKRLVIITAESNATIISAAASVSQNIKQAGFQLNIVSLNLPESAFKSLTYNKYFSIPLSSIGTPNSAVSQSIINNGVCSWDANIPMTTKYTCAQTTPKTTVTTKSGGAKATTVSGRVTHSPIITEADYMNCSCYVPDTWIDIMIALDISASMGPSGLAQVEASIMTLIGQMTIDRSVKKSIRVGLVTFSEKATMVANVGKFKDEDDLIEALIDLQTDNSDSVNLEMALSLSAQGLSVEEGGRGGNVQKVIIVYSSAYKSGGESDPYRTASQLKSSGYNIITVAFVQKEETDIVLKIGELASPRMNFTSYQNPILIEQLQDALCQCNCICPDGWHPLVINYRRFGECYFLTELDADWQTSKGECGHLTNTEGMLIYINSYEKQDILYKYAKGRLESLGIPIDKMNFHIGLNYQAQSKSYIWDTVDVSTSSFTSWDTAYPNTNMGNCVKAVKSGFSIKWRNEDCITSNTKAMCLALPCDTTNYCGP